MQDTAYELLSMGMRYVFLLLAALMLIRAWRLMGRERREHRRALRLLPDAGLVGELVELQSGQGIPLPREGLMGSGHNCDVRFAGLRRREIEFQFRPGEGMRLIPMHRNRGCALDGVPLSPGRDRALHGTVLETGELAFRFRLFAGLDLPARTPPEVPAVNGQDRQPQPEPQAWSSQDPSFRPSPVPPDGDGSQAAWEVPPPASPSGGELGMTWQYAPLPPRQGDAEAELPEAQPAARRRRAWRGQGEGPGDVR